MSTGEAVAEATGQTEEGADREQAGGRRDILLLWLLFVVSSIVYVFVSRRQLIPMLGSDEFIYGQLADQVAHGEGFDWRGDPISLRSALYVYLIAPFWTADSTETAYALTKAFGAVAASSVVFPVWLLARELVGSRLAFAPAVLAVAGAWMASANGVLTENVAYPLATAALCAAVMAIRRPGSRWGWWALGVAALATWARSQMVALLAVILLAFAVDCVRAWPAWSERAQLHRPFLVLGAVVVAVLGLLALVTPDSLTGIYSGADLTPAFGKIAEVLGRHWLGMVILAGFLPAVVVLAIAVVPASWREEDAGPLLSVLVPAIVVFGATAGMFVAGQKIPWTIERYVQYVMPLAFIALVLPVRRPELLRPLIAFGVAGAVALLLLLAKDPLVVVEERALYGTIHRIDQLTGLTGGAAVMLAGLLLGIGGVALLVYGRRWLGATGMAVAVGGLTALALVVQSQASSQWGADVSRAIRAEYPEDLQWVDRTGDGKVTRVVSVMNSPLFDPVDFFNRDVEPVFIADNPLYGRSVNGKSCKWRIKAGGAPEFDRGCGAASDTFLFDDLGAQLTFSDERVLAESPGAGKVVLAGGSKQVKSLILFPCDRPQTQVGSQLGDIVQRVNCVRTSLAAAVWADADGELRVRLKTKDVTHRAALGRTIIELPSNATTTIRLPVKKGANKFDVPIEGLYVGEGEVAVVGAELDEGDRTTRLM